METKPTNFIIWSIVLVTLNLFYIGCSENPPEKVGYGQLNIQLTDAPFPHHLVSEVNMTIFKVDARYKEDSGKGEQMMAKDQVDNFVILMTEEIPINLLEFTNGITKPLVNTEVMAGYYDMIRVYVAGVKVVLTDGTVFNLEVPNGIHTGINVAVTPGLRIKDGLTADLLLDFDLKRSFVPKNNSRNLDSITGFNFNPEIKASNRTTSGTLMGVITENRNGVQVGVREAKISVYAADTIHASTSSDVGGSYMMMGLEASNYTLKIEKEGFRTPSTQEVIINRANITVKDLELDSE